MTTTAPIIYTERSLIASALGNPVAADTVLEQITPSDLTDAGCRAALEAMRTVQGRGEPISMASVSMEAGMVVYEVVTDSTAVYWSVQPLCDIILEHSRRRKLRRAYQDEIRRIDDGSTVAESADRIVAEVGSIMDGGGGAGLSQAQQLDELVSTIDTAPVDSAPWCVRGLHDMLGPMGRGDLIILGGRPSCGKTALAMSEAIFLARNGCPVGFFSLEMSARDLIIRQVSHETGISFASIRNRLLTSAERDQIREVYQGMKLWPIIVDDTARMTPSRLRRRARAMVQREKVQVVFVDYIQQMEGDEVRRGENRQQQVTAISRELKLTARELDITIIALSQLSRQNESRQDKRPQLSDLRESGAIEQDADSVLFVHKEACFRAGKEVIDHMVLVGKQRNGPIGEASGKFDPVRMKWS